jgi:hypothetical protein
MVAKLPYLQERKAGYYYRPTGMSQSLLKLEVAPAGLVLLLVG